MLDEIRRELEGNPKTFLVTGVAGFIGSNLAEFLLSCGQNVIGLDNFITGHRYNLDDVFQSVGPTASTRFRMIEGDIADFEVCQSACADVNIILHQAALGSVPRSIKDPLATNRANVTGFLNMITAAKEAGVKRFIYASSSSVYGDSTELPKNEARTGNQLSPYAVTKMTNELYASVFARNFGIQTIGLRYFNVFGRRQDPEGDYAAVIPKWIAAMMRDEPVFINGDGETSRDFCYIDNVIQINLLAALTENADAINSVYNVAVGDQTTLNELYASVRENLIPYFSDVAKRQPAYRDFRAGDIRHSLASIDRAKNLLNYSPSHRISEGLATAMKWYVEKLK